MQISYKRSMNQNYLVLQWEGTGEPKGYQTAILLENTVPGLLPCRIQRINGESFFFYNITGCQSIQSLYECRKIQEKGLTELLLACAEVKEELNEYLLESDSLLLEAKYMYQNKTTGKIQFVYFPAYGKETDVQIREFMESLIPRIDHEDPRAVTLGYGVYKASVKDTVTKDMIRKFLQSQPEEEKPLLCEKTLEYNRQEKERKRILDDFYTQEEEEYRGMAGVFSLAGGILLCAGMIFALYHFRVMSFPMVLLLGTALVLALGGIISVSLIRKKREEVQASQEDLFQESSEEGTKKEEPEEEEDLTVVLNREEGGGYPYLESLEEQEPVHFALKKEVTFIGKWSQAVDLCISDPTVSRTHARIRKKEEGDYLTDLNSRNGTLLNEICLNPEEEYLLKEGDVLQFSRVRFRYCKVEKRKQG